MDRQSLIDFTQRIAHAPDNDARVRQFVDLAPSSTLARLGLARRPSLIGTVLSYTGAIAFGALVGAGAALLLTPTTGPELQTKLRRQAKRVSRDVKMATGRVERAASEDRDQVAPTTSTDGASASSNHARQGAHA